MQKRVAKIKQQLTAEAKAGLFYKDMPLYQKEARRLKDQGFSVERLFLDKFDHPERDNFYCRISWESTAIESSFAYFLFCTAKNKT